ncbi:MAG: AbrB/MazE/SpoVT family DNA-binding domain-containing protein [Patescibacteria group bacterium]
MQTAVLTLQSKGQIMLPKEWRDDLGSDVYQAVKDGDIIVLKPVQIASDAEVLRAASKVIKKNKPLLKSLVNK